MGPSRFRASGGSELGSRAVPILAANTCGLQARDGAEPGCARCTIPPGGHAASNPFFGAAPIGAAKCGLLND
jgi:hypothetical protein